MCFVAGRLNPGTDQPLVVASNRDEFYDRPGEPPALRSGRSYDFYAPRDARAGGTWMGINETGLLVALTNRLTDHPLPDAPSRGQLVVSLLESTRDRGDSLRFLEELDPNRFNPFSLLLLDPGGLGFYTHRLEDEDRWKQEERGEFFLSNRTGFHRDSAGALLPWTSRVGCVEAEELRSFCRSHEDFLGRGYLCLHGEEAGTRSSSLLFVDRQHGFRYEYREGHPCEGPYGGMEVPEGIRRGVKNRWLNPVPDTN